MSRLNPGVVRRRRESAGGLPPYWTNNTNPTGVSNERARPSPASPRRRRHGDAQHRRCERPEFERDGDLPPHRVEDDALRQASGRRERLQAHAKHAADIIPAPRGGCPRSLLTAAAGGRAFEVAMTGEAENPAGDPVGTGTATIRMRAGQGQVCYRLAVSGLTGVNAAHIHRGAAGVAGPVVDPAQHAERRRYFDRLRSGCPDARGGDPRRARLVLRQRSHGGVAGRRDPRAAHRHVCGVAWNDLGPRPEGHVGAERDAAPPSSGSARTRPSATGCTPRTSRCRRRRRTSIAVGGSQRSDRRRVHRPGGGRQLERLRAGRPALIDEMVETSRGST